MESNALALAYSEASLWLNTYCHANAEAYGRVCSFTKANGNLNVETTYSEKMKTVSINVMVSSASTSFAFAVSKAEAEAYGEVEAHSYTDVGAYCFSIANKSPLCAGGSAGTDLTLITESKARTFSDAVSEAGAGGFGKAKASVFASGASINTVSGHVVAFARSWVFANAATSATAFATAAIDIINETFATICASQHEEICGSPENDGKGVCGMSPKDACASAYAFGKAHGDILSSGLAKAFIKTFSDSKFITILKADVDCRNTPKLKWTVSRGGAELSCPK